MESENKNFFSLRFATLFLKRNGFYSLDTPRTVTLAINLWLRRHGYVFARNFGNIATCESEANLSVAKVSNKIFVNGNSLDKPGGPIFYLKISSDAEIDETGD